MSGHGSLTSPRLLDAELGDRCGPMAQTVGPADRHMTDNMIAVGTRWAAWRCDGADRIVSGLREHGSWFGTFGPSPGGPGGRSMRGMNNAGRAGELGEFTPLDRGESLRLLA